MTEVPKDVFKSLHDIVDYLIGEKADYQRMCAEDGHESQKDHVWLDVKRVRKWLKTQYRANDDNWMTAPDEKCPKCLSEGNRRIAISSECPRYKSGDKLMCCMGCGNATRFTCAAPDEDGDLLEEGCGWWWQTRLHPEASEHASMGGAPAWDWKKYA